MKILILEDDPGCQKALCLTLSCGKENECDTVATLDQAVALLKSGAYDLILADLFIPPNEPREVMARVLKHAGRTPVVGVTGAKYEHVSDAIGVADAAILKEEIPAPSIFRDWLADIVKQKKKDGAVMADAKRIAAWLGWKSSQQQNLA